MSRFNPYSLKRRDAVEETRTFTDASQPDLSLTLTLRASSGTAAIFAANEQVDRWEAMYITGEDGEEPLPMVDPQGEAIPINRTLLSLIAKLVQMEVPQEGERPYDMKEWATLAERAPFAFAAVGRFAAELQNKALSEQKNG